MTWTHPPDALLDLFVEGQIDEHRAVAVAIHIDGCPECAARAIAIDPLAPAFAAASEPVVPPDLAGAILTRASAPRHAGPEPAIAAGLLAAAGLVMVIGGDPGGLAIRGAAALSAVFTALGTLFAHLGVPSLSDGLSVVSPATWALLAMVLLVMSVASVRRLEARRHS